VHDQTAQSARRSQPSGEARALLEQSLSGNASAIPPLADILIKGEGGPVDARRAVSLLSDRRCF